MEIKTMSKENLEEAKKIYMYCFSVPESEICEWISDDFKFENYIGYFDNDTLASCMGVLPYDIYYFNSIVKMGGISGVATLPEYRHNHCASTLLLKTLEIMKKNGQVFSMLGPFSYPFYRKYGWELGFRTLKFELPISDFKHYGKTKKNFRPISIDDIDILNPIYNGYMSKYNGTVKRTNDLWKNKLTLKGHKYAYGAFDDNNNLLGYIIYELNNRKFFVTEIVYKDFDAKIELFRFIYSHSAQVDNVLLSTPIDNTTIDLLENPRKSIKIVPEMMVRVVDAKKSLELYKYQQDGEFTIRVDDPYCSWNNKSFKVNVSDGNNTVEEINLVKTDITCSIQIFSQIMFGFSSINEPLSINKITINDNKKDLLMKMFSKKTTYINDHF